MNRTPKTRLLLVALASMFSLGGGLSAQTTAPRTEPAGKEDEIYELSPFTVNAEGDTGYVASGTLAGSRLRTDLRDVAASVSVITKEFMQDIGVTNLNELLNYTTGTEVAGLAGNFSNHGTGADFTDFFGSVRSVQGANRVRGVAAADQTRDYFITGVPLDSYIVERVEVSRGPNSMLFGLGSAGGIINSSLIKAAPNKTKTKLEAQYGQFETNRFSLDHNQVLIQDKLAVRVAGLYSDKRYQIDPANVRDERYFVTATWRPWKGATLRVSTEQAKQFSNKPYNAPPTDSYSWWWDLGKPVYNPITGVGTYLGTMPADPNLRAWSATGAPTNNLTSGGSSRFILIQEDPNSARFGITGQPADIMGIEGFNDRVRLNAAGTAYANDGMRWLNSPKAYLQQLNRTSNPTLNNFWRDPKLTDPSIFNFFDHGLEGDAKYEWAFSKSYNAVFEQRLGSNAGVELAFAKEKQNTGFVQPYQFRNHAINIDIATHLPNGDVNPNLGRPMITTADGFVQNPHTERQSHRATAYYDLDLNKVGNNWLGKLLGRHIFTGSYTSQKQRENSNGGRLYALGVDYLEADAINQSNRGIPLLLNSTRFMPVMSYIGPDLRGAAAPQNNGIQGLTVGYPRADQLTSVTGLHYPSPPTSPVALASWQKRTFSVVRNERYDLRSTSMNPTLRGDEVDSLVFVANSYWWDKTLVSTLGWRKDSFKTFDAGLPPRDPVTGLVINDSSWKWTTPTLDDSQTSFNYGLVLHTPPSLRGKLPFGADVSVTYNKSDNFRPSAPRANFRDESVAPPTGTTEEWGALISLFDNKLELRATKYETQATLATDAAFRELHNQVVRRISSQITNNSDTAYLAVANPAAVAAWNSWQQTPYAQQLLDTYRFSFATDPGTGRVTVTNNERIDIVVSTTDIVATGYEFDVVYNPTRQWRIAFNAARQQTVSANTGADFAELITQLDPVWAGTAAALIDGTNSTNTLGNSWATTRANAERRINSDGQPSTELRKWRFNVVTNYSFNEGRLKGWRIGGAYRWQDKAAIGYPVKALASGTLLYDVSNPYFGPTEANLDGWIGYSRKIFGDKVKWSAQLNVRNIGKGDFLIPVSAQPTGAYDSMRIGEPQTWLLTNTFEF